MRRKTRSKGRNTEPAASTAREAPCAQTRAPVATTRCGAQALTCRCQAPITGWYAGLSCCTSATTTRGGRARLAAKRALAAAGWTSSAVAAPCSRRSACCTFSQRHTNSRAGAQRPTQSTHAPLRCLQNHICTSNCHCSAALWRERVLHAKSTVPATSSHTTHALAPRAYAYQRADYARSRCVSDRAAASAPSEARPAEPCEGRGPAIRGARHLSRNRGAARTLTARLAPSCACCRQFLFESYLCASSGYLASFALPAASRDCLALYCVLAHSSGVRLLIHRVYISLYTHLELDADLTASRGRSWQLGSRPPGPALQLCQGAKPRFA